MRWAMTIFSRVIARSFLGILAAGVLGVAAAPAASAYGPEQWETTFSFNCNAPVAVCSGFGFWGWCAFGGNGTTGDCQFTAYNREGILGMPAFDPTHFSVNYTGWVISKPTFGLPKDLPGFFAIGPGTLTLTGPGASLLQLFYPSSFTCPLTATPSPNFLCDTGIPGVAGHYTYSQIPLFPFLGPQPGLHFNSQVNQIGS
jgi:hypothetical protein